MRDLYNCESGLVSGPQNSNKHVIGTRKVGVIRNSGTVALSGPLIYIGDQEKWLYYRTGRIIRPVVKRNFTVLCCCVFQALWTNQSQSPLEKLLEQQKQRHTDPHWKQHADTTIGSILYTTVKTWQWNGRIDFLLYEHMVCCSVASTNHVADYNTNHVMMCSTTLHTVNGYED